MDKRRNATALLPNVSEPSRQIQYRIRPGPVRSNPRLRRTGKKSTCTKIRPLWALCGAPAFRQHATPETRTLQQEKIRVLIANSTRIWRDMLYNTIREQPDVEVVGDVSDEHAIVAAVERTNPDCVIVPLELPAAAMPICTQILSKRPTARIVAIGEASDVVEIYWLSDEREIRRTYTTASREAIVRALHFSTG